MKSNILVAVLAVTFISCSTKHTSAQAANDYAFPDANAYLKKIQDGFKEMDEKKWGSAVLLWQDLVKANPYYGDFWFWLGECRYENNEPDSAVAAFKQALYMGAQNYPKAECAYLIAKCYAKKKVEKLMFEWLQKAFDSGYRYVMNARADNAFEKYFADKRFKQIVGLPEAVITDRIKGWRFDLNLLVKEIKRRGPNPYRYISEKEFDAAVKKLHDKIPALPDLQVIIELQKIITLIGDGHSSIYPFISRPELQKNLPVLFYLFDEGFFITDTDKKYESLAGCQVLAFDGNPIEEIVNAMHPVLNRDNDLVPGFLATLFYLRNPAMLHAMGLIKKAQSVELTLKSQNGDVKKIVLSADNSPNARMLWNGLPAEWITYFQSKKTEPPLHLSNIYTAYWFKDIPEYKTVYFQFNSVFSTEELPLDKFLDSMFTFIESGNTEKLIIDLRLNNGGNTQLTPMVLERIIGCKKINRKGKLCVIIGGRLFSAAVNFVGYLQRFTQATFFGEPTKCSPNFIGEDNAFELPYSKIIANVSDQYWQSSWPDDQRQWFNPWLYVPYTFKDYSQSKDAVIDAILNYKR